MKKLLLLPLSLLFLLVSNQQPLSAQNLALNDSFGLGGVSHCGHPDYADTTGDLLYQADGKFVLVGDSYDRSTNEWYIIICKFNSNGNPDTSFGTEGVVIKKNGFRSIGRGAALQADGKIIVVGSENTSNGSSGILAAVYRFNADGSDDSSFGNSGTKTQGFNGEFFDAHAMADGKIVLMGTNYDSRTSQIFRLFSDGEPDTTFSTDGRASRGPSLEFQTGYDARLAPNGNVYAASTRNDGSGNKLVISSTMHDGEPDTTFNNSGSVFTEMLSIGNTPVGLEVDDANNIYVGVTSRPDNSQFYKINLFKYKPDGTVDTSFGDNGHVQMGLVNEFLSLYGIRATPSGNVYVLGKDHSGFGIGAVFKMDPNGALDATFQGNGYLAADLNGNSGTHWVSDIIEDADGSIYLAGWDFAAQSGDMAIAKFTPMVNTSLEIPFEQTALNIYPNPSTGTIFLSRDIEEGFDYLEIYDSLGRLVHSEELTLLEKSVIEVSDLPKGNYFARVSGREKQSTTKLVIL